MDDGLFLTVEQAAERLNCNPETIRRRIRRGAIKAQLIPGPRGDQYSIPLSELHTQDAEIVPVPQLPIAVVNQIIDANKQAVEAVVVPLQAQIMEQQTIIQAQADEIRKLRERIEKDATHQSQQVIGINNALKDIADQQKKAAAAASAREAQPWWQRLFGG